MKESILSSILFFVGRDDDSNLTLEKLHDLAVDMARKKRHQLLDRHYSAIETVASVQDNWGGMIEPPLSQMSSSRSSNKSRVTFATGSAESMNENDIGLSRGKYRSLALYRSAGKLPRRTTETDLEELKRNRDDFDIDLGNKDLSGSRSTPHGSTSPGSEKSMLVSFAWMCYTILHLCYTILLHQGRPDFLQ